MWTLRLVFDAFLCVTVLAGLASCQDFYDGCQVTKGCQGFPANCVAGKNCDLAVSYEAIAIDKYKFEIITGSTSDPQYIAAGVSMSGGMPDSSVVVCRKKELSVEMYWNLGGDDNSIPIADTQLGLSETSVKVDGGRISCSFVRDAITKFETPDSTPKNVTINLNTDLFNVIFASGDVREKTGKIAYHDDNRDVMTEKVRLSDFNKFWFNEYNGCSTDKGCYALPTGCIENGNCAIFVSYTGISRTQYKFELLGKADTENSSYVAAGISLSSSMPDTSVIACSKLNEAMRIEMYWNDGYDSLPVNPVDTGLSEATVEYSDGYLRCSVVREAVTKFETPSDSTKVVDFDLNNVPYFLLLARGKLSAQGRLIEHSERAKSSELMNIFEYGKRNPTYSGCSTEKGCYGHPDGCIRSESCTMFVSYEGLSPYKYKFELLGQVDNEASAYVAAGISLSSSMTNTSVIACSKFGQATRIEMYWNEGHSSLPVNPIDTGLSEVSVEYSDGYLRCSVVRETVTKFQTPSDPPEEVEFDLNSVPYYLLLARGKLNSQGLLAKHSEMNSSTELVNISEYGILHPIYSGCSTEKGCFGYPDGCLESHNCSMIASYSGIAADKYKFEIYGKANTDNSSYAAVGLGTQAAMSDANVMACSKFNDQIRVEMYWNDGHNSKPLSNTSFGLSEISGKLEGGYLYCSVVREAVTEIETPTDPIKKVTFDLNSNPHHLLLAKGDLDDQGLLDMPSQIHLSDEKIELFAFNPFNNDVYDGCQKTKGCFGMPQSCEESKSCKVLITYVTLAESGDVTFTISGAANVNEYLAVGLGGSEEMNDASVMFCYALSDGTADVAMSYNAPSFSNILEDPKVSLKDRSSKYEGGILTCTFTRDKISTFKEPSSGKNVTYDLSKLYHLLLAKAPVEADSSAIGFKLTYHGGDRLASSKPVNLASFESVGVATDKVVRWHGALMVAAWLFLACTGTMTARYGKKMDMRVMGKDIWFRVHQLCMGSAWTLTLASVILMFVDKGVKPLSMDSVKLNAHAAVGMAVTVLAFIQPFMAYFRPHPGTSRRPLFNVAHLSVGLSAVLLAFVAIGLATKFEQLELDDGAIIVGTFAGFFVAFHLILTIYSKTIGDTGRAVPVFLFFFAVGAFAASIGMIVVIA